MMGDVDDVVVVVDDDEDLFFFRLMSERLCVFCF